MEQNKFRHFLVLILVVALALELAPAPKKWGVVQLSGTGSVPGGDHDRIEIYGKGKIESGINVQVLKIDGSASVAGDVKAIMVRSSGLLKVSGKMDADSIDASGSVQVMKKLAGKPVHFSGVAESEGVEASDFSGTGLLTVLKDITANTFKLTGAFSAGGSLKAAQVNLKMEGLSSAREISGQKLVFKPGSRASPKVTRLTAEVIQGDELYLENVIARFVKGRVVKIGPGCAIDLVQYKESIMVDKGSRVGKNVKG